MKYPLNLEQSLALLQFHSQHGRYWKTRLRNMWHCGRITKTPVPPLLQQIRNTSAHVLNTLDIELVRLWVVDQQSKELQRRAGLYDIYLKEAMAMGYVGVGEALDRLAELHTQIPE